MIFLAFFLLKICRFLPSEWELVRHWGADLLKFLILFHHPLNFIPLLIVRETLVSSFVIQTQYQSRISSSKKLVLEYKAIFLYIPFTGTTYSSPFYGSPFHQLLPNQLRCFLMFDCPIWCLNFMGETNVFKSYKGMYIGLWEQAAMPSIRDAVPFFAKQQQWVLLPSNNRVFVF